MKHFKITLIVNNWNISFTTYSGMFQCVRNMYETFQGTSNYWDIETFQIYSHCELLQCFKTTWMAWLRNISKSPEIQMIGTFRYDSHSEWWKHFSGTFQGCCKITVIFLKYFKTTIIDIFQNISKLFEKWMNETFQKKIGSE